MSFDFDELDLAEQAPARLWQVQNSLECTPAPKTERVSGARTWFEIKRYFAAEARQGHEDWKVRYARELVLKAIFEALHRDGFVVIDASMPTSTAKGLLRSMAELCSAALGSAERMQPLRDDCPAPKGWVGSQIQRASAASLGHGYAQDCVSMSRSLHGQNCEVTFAGQSCEAVRPQSKSEFLGIMRLFVHAIADNSLAEVQVPASDKVLVQLSFGNKEAFCMLLGPV
ncbi:YRB2 [Symbiodinium natans]|uniref:YRB2 protein n=1 Tax=Symbiodinium natans TaxID=878477 RepID=A0A812PKS5_9DINO|nr:YRB2 [Symbiodinium natans]